MLVGRESIRGGVQDTRPICYVEEECLIYDSCRLSLSLVLMLVLLWYVVHVCFVVRENMLAVGRVREVVMYVVFLVELRRLGFGSENLVLISLFLRVG